MKSAGALVPRPAAVQAALRKTTEALACELARPTGATPDWSEFEWRAARAAAAIHGIAPLLAGALRWEGPPGWMAFLQEQKAHTVSRHRRIEDLSKRIDDGARRAGLPVVALKGAALHASGLYAAGERPMADLDLLVRESDLAPAARLLAALEFRETVHYWKNWVFVPNDARESGGLGEQPGNSVKIELHWRIREKLPAALTDISDLVFGLRPHPGLNAYASNAALLMHLVLHAAGSMASRTLRLLQLNDLARLAARMSGEDWHELLRQDCADCGLWWALPPLRLASRYYPSAIPARVLTALTRACPWRLNRMTARQQLTDVSLSNIWVQAFPGIEWSQSVAEMLRYAVRRVWPSQEALMLRRESVGTEAWATQNPWDQLSQRARMLRWVASRPTRTGSMYVVHESLMQPN
jgi:Uncharacterised nucleotidyltransferase